MNQLTYEDCAELKAAGFPQDNAEKYWWVHHSFPKIKNPEKYNEAHWKHIEYRVISSKEESEDWGVNDKLCAAPTLEELIAACGEDFRALGSPRYMGKGTWVAGSLKDKFFGEGSTPSQAVKNLWIALKK